MNFKKYISKALSYSEYNHMVKELVSQGRTTGDEQTDVKIDFTKLNLSRTKRLDKTAVLSEEAKLAFQNIDTPQTWLVITEAWCGDAAQSLPFLNKMAQLSENIDLKIVLRDENPVLMDAFLTNGSQSIPIVIMLDDSMNVFQTWGPRSKAATKLINDYKVKHGKIDSTIKEMLQVWYNNDKGISIVNDILETMEVKA
ncbi:thioredoxin family protein [Ulvibacter antarcticus]|uniref:Thioredoxin-like protein n=1 Tax=Ulvibacter antarcticus TaxID=442714 RepID=A0A3L9YEB3_9FLAO|nr:thioredoxin family protein [Ulvibacter antarcticus]RMA58714.1 thioredoxin-like protein [Ulvibacter antarcticus]